MADKRCNLFVHLSIQEKESISSSRGVSKIESGAIAKVRILVEGDTVKCLKALRIMLIMF